MGMLPCSQSWARSMKGARWPMRWSRRITPVRGLVRGETGMLLIMRDAVQGRGEDRRAVRADVRAAW